MAPGLLWRGGAGVLREQGRPDLHAGAQPGQGAAPRRPADCEEINGCGNSK